MLFRSDLVDLLRGIGQELVAELAREVVRALVLEGGLGRRRRCLIGGSAWLQLLHRNGEVVDDGCKTLERKQSVSGPTDAETEEAKEWSVMKGGMSRQARSFIYSSICVSMRMRPGRRAKAWANRICVYIDLPVPGSCYILNLGSSSTVANFSSSVCSVRESFTSMCLYSVASRQAHTSECEASPLVQSYITQKYNDKGAYRPSGGTSCPKLLL